MTSMPPDPSVLNSSSENGSAQPVAESSDRTPNSLVAHPIRPKSAFLFFLGEHRAKVKAAFPDLALDMESSAASASNSNDSQTDSRLPSKRAFSTLTQLMGVEWRRLSAEERATYEMMSAADKRRYQTELAQMKQLQQQFYGNESAQADSAPQPSHNEFVDDDDAEPQANVASAVLQQPQD